MERGHIGSMRLDDIRRVAAALDIRIDVYPRWRAGDLDRLLNAKHSELHELVARWFAAELPEWVLAPEVSFAIYGERGVIDILAWHEPTTLAPRHRAQDGDRGRERAARDRGPEAAARLPRSPASADGTPRTVSQWLIVADTRTNRRRLDAHLGRDPQWVPGRRVGHPPLAATAPRSDRGRHGRGQPPLPTRPWTRSRSRDARRARRPARRARSSAASGRSADDRPTNSRTVPGSTTRR